MKIIIISFGLSSQFSLQFVYLIEKHNCRCQNLNCWTGEYKCGGERMVAEKYCQTENCRTIGMSDFEVCLYIV